MLVRSGSEPPVLCAAGSMDGFNSWSGDGNILKDTSLYQTREKLLSNSSTHLSRFQLQVRTLVLGDIIHIKLIGM